MIMRQSKPKRQTNADGDVFEPGQPDDFVEMYFEALDDAGVDDDLASIDRRIDPRRLCQYPPKDDRTRVLRTAVQSLVAIGSCVAGAVLFLLLIRLIMVF